MVYLIKQIIFLNEISQTKTEIKIEKRKDYNNACRLADFSQKSCDVNSGRHSAVENFIIYLILVLTSEGCFWELNFF